MAASARSTAVVVEDEKPAAAGAGGQVYTADVGGRRSVQTLSGSPRMRGGSGVGGRRGTVAGYMQEERISHPSALARRVQGATLNLAGTRPTAREQAELATAFASAERHFGMAVSSLDLSNNRITDAGLQVLMRGLVAMPRLGELNLSSNMLGPQAVCFLAPLLQPKSPLSFLSLCENRIGDAGAITLAEALQNNMTLLALDLSHNDIGVEGTLALTQVLKVCCVRLCVCVCLFACFL